MRPRSKVGAGVAGQQGWARACSAGPEGELRGGGDRELGWRSSGLGDPLWIPLLTTGGQPGPLGAASCVTARQGRCPPSEPAQGLLSTHGGQAGLSLEVP